MKLAPPPRILPAAGAALLGLSALFTGLNSFRAEDDPDAAFVYDRTESVLHLSLDAPSGSSLSMGGDPVTLGVLVERHSRRLDRFHPRRFRQWGNR